MRQKSGKMGGYSHSTFSRCMALFLAILLGVNTLLGNMSAEVVSAETVKFSDVNLGSVDHIDIGVSASAVLVINGETMISEVDLVANDFKNNNVTVTAVWWNGEEWVDLSTVSTTGTAGFTMNTSSLSSSTGSSGIEQVRVGGTYPVGNAKYPVEYTFTLTKDVTFTSETTDESYTVTMSFSSSFTYFDTDNDCPGLSSNYNTGTGSINTQAGMDFVLSDLKDSQMLTIQKYVYLDGMLASDNSDVEGTEFVYGIYQYDSDTKAYTKVDEVTLTVSADGLGIAMLQVEEGTYYVVESDGSDLPQTIGDYVYDEDGDATTNYYFMTVITVKTVTTETSGNQQGDDTSATITTTAYVEGANSTTLKDYQTESASTSSSTSSSSETSTSGGGGWGQGQGQGQTTTTTTTTTTVANVPTFVFSNYYVTEKVDVEVTKVWDDNDDALGIRPDSITVNLINADTKAVINSATLDESNSWYYKFENLPSTSGGSAINYGIEEVSVAGYTSVTTAGTSYEDQTSGNTVYPYTITNTVNVGALALTKTVNADSSIDTSNETFTFYVSGFDTTVTSVSGILTDSSGTETAVEYGVSDGVATVTIKKGETVTLTYLTPGDYKVYELSEDAINNGTTTVTTSSGYAWTVGDGNGTTAAVVAGEVAEAAIENTITGTATVVLTKVWEDQSNYWSTRPLNSDDEQEIEVTLLAVELDSNGDPVTDTNGTYVAYTDSDDTVYYYVAYEDSEGNTYVHPNITITGSGDTWTYSLSGVAAYDVDGNKLSYVVIETAVDGYTTSYTYALDGTVLTPADNVNATITNTLNVGTVTVTKVVLDADGKEVSSTENDDDFRFALWAYDDDTKTTTTAYGTGTVSAGGTVTFSNIPYGTYYLTEVLEGSHDHSYDTSVTINGEDADVTENFIVASNVKSHTATVTIDEENASQDIEIIVTNQEEEVSVSLATVINGTKTLVTDNEVEKTFSYTVQDASGATVETGTATVSDTASTSAITWTIVDEDAFTYTEVGEYTYVIYEEEVTGTGTGGVVYDATRYTLTITVSKSEETGELIATASMTKNVQNDDGTRTTSSVESDKSDNSSEETTIYSFVAASTAADFELEDSFTAAFTNYYDTTETSIILRATKSLTGRSLEQGEFSILVQEVDDNGDPITGGTSVTRSNGATGAFGYEIVYTEAGVYYYKVSEVIPDDATQNADGTYTYKGVTYDNSYYIIYVDVDDDDGVLTVVETEVAYYNYDTDSGTWNVVLGANYSYDSMVFYNTYEATGDGELSVIKVLMGRDFNVGDTFTFTITALDTAAPTLTDPNEDGVTFTDNGDGTYTVTVTVLDTDTSEKSQNSNYSNTYLLTWLLASLSVDEGDVGSWVYRISEVAETPDETDTANGMTYDIATYGHLIEVTVTDNGDGTLDVIPYSTNDTDWNGDTETDTSKSVIVNSFSQGSMNIYGEKTWVDGNAEHDNTEEVELTLYYSTDGGTKWTAWTLNDDNTTYSIDGEGSYSVAWGTLYTNRWRILGLPEYDPSGAEYTYKVVETAIDGYVTTYIADPGTYSEDDATNDAEAVPESNASDNRYTIINTIKQEYITISGTKTWVDKGQEHENEKEVILTVTRKSDSMTTAETLVEGTDYTVTWTGDSYIIVGTGAGLEKYDEYGYIYSYSVAETEIENYTTDTAFYFDDDENPVFNFTNTQVSDDPEDPVKTETSVVDENDEVQTDTYNNVDDANDSLNGTVYVAVGDTVNYKISYYNNNNVAATVVITDALDSGVEFVSAGVSQDTIDAGYTYTIQYYDANGDEITQSIIEAWTGSTSWKESVRTVVWTIIDVERFTEDYVTLSVKVTDAAKVQNTGETVAEITNQASVAIGNAAAVDTNIVENPLEPDDPTEPTKTLIAVEDENEVTQTDTYQNDDDATDELNGSVIVAVGDLIYYSISYYNYTNTTATIVITDVLDPGVEFRWGTQGASYNSATHTVTWTRTTPAYTTGTVTLAVKVTEDAQTLNVVTDLETGEQTESSKTTATVDNQATVTISTATISNTSYTDIITNPLEDDDPVDPTKTISSSSAYGYDATEEIEYDTSDPDDPGTLTGAEVGEGDVITYDITYYNHYSHTATVAITDELDAGVEFVDASTGTSGTGGTSVEVKYYKSDGVTEVVDPGDGTDTWKDDVRIVKWTISDVAPYTEGKVVLEVRVTTAAKDVEEGETTATVENQATVDVGDDTGNKTNVVINPYNPDEPAEPTKEVSAHSDAGVEGADVEVGDQITYEIDYYNHNNSEATVVITDVLDPGVTFVSATGSGATIQYYDESGNEVTDLTAEGALESVYKVVWIIDEVDPYKGGTVYLTVKVTEDAKTLNGVVTYVYNDETEEWEATTEAGDTATVDNQASVVIAENEYYTNLVTNEIEDDDPETTKTITSITDADSVETQTASTSDELDMAWVGVGDQITYTISYYNHTNTTATITLTDVLDDGVVLVSASTDADKGITPAYYDENGDTVTDLTASGAVESVRTVVWTITDVEAYKGGTVTLTVKVTEDAKTLNTVVNAETGETSELSLTSATVDNQASEVVSTDADNTYWTNLVTNPLEEDEEQDPTKTISSSSQSGYTEDVKSTTINEGEDSEKEVLTYDTVGVGDMIQYDISYYNSYNETVTVRIWDVLDEDVTFVSASQDGTVKYYDESLSEVDTSVTGWRDAVRYVEWTIENVAPYTEGTVKLVVQVTESALNPNEVKDLETDKVLTYNEGTATVDNQAEVTMYGGDVENTSYTNIVSNELDDDDPGYPEKSITETTAEDTTDGSVAVGDEITYAIEYYNYTNTIRRVIITDVLDPGVELVSASVSDDVDSSHVIITYLDENGYSVDTSDTDWEQQVRTVVWTISDVTAYTHGYAYLTVRVTEDALTLNEVTDLDSGVVLESSTTTTTVDNQASVMVVGNTTYTNIITNPIDEDDPNPTKTISSIVDEDGSEKDAEEGSYLNDSVDIGDQVTYELSYYNHTNTVADITLTDELDDGVLFVSASDDTENGITVAYYDADDNNVSDISTDEARESVRKVVWTIADVDPYTSGTVTLTVEVTEDARTLNDIVTYVYNEETGEWVETTTAAEDTTVATIDNQMSEQVSTDPENTYYSEVVTNPLEDDEDTKQTKTETTITDADGNSSAAELTKSTVENDVTYDTYETVKVGETITYEIEYYNYYNDAKTVTITDKLDAGVEYVTGSATDGGVYDEATHSITWTFDSVTAFTGGTVSFQVKVLESALTVASGDDSATVENRATVDIGGTENKTNIVINPLADEDAVDPVKEVSESSTAGSTVVSTADNGDVTYEEVAVGDYITYEISYTNHYNEPTTVIVMDVLDLGVDYVDGSASDGGVYDSLSRTVSWTIENVPALSEGTVSFTVQVNAYAKVLASEETEATVENEAQVKVGIGEYMYTNLVIHPIEPDDPEDPVKSISSDSTSGYDADATIVYDTTDTEDTGTLAGSSVAVGDMIEYDLYYYNHHNSTATVEIVDELDEGADFISATGTKLDTALTDEESTVEKVGYDYVTYTYDETSHTVTWTIYNATPYESGEVTVVVQVNEDAKTVASDETTATVENEATVQIGVDHVTYTNLVVNTVDPDEPSEPAKTIDPNSAAGVDGADVAVGDQITYIIDYYNHTNMASTVTITDVLDAGVDFVSASGTEASEATADDAVIYEVTTAEDGTTTVTWTLTDVTAYTGGTVSIVVEVNEDALTVDEGDTSADVENQATVKVGDTENTTNVVVSTLVDDEEQNPTKTVTTITDTEGTEREATITSTDDDDITYEEVSVGEQVTYEITYYNHYNASTTVTITDVLDDGVEYVEGSASDDGEYDEDTHTVTWTIEDVAAYTEGSVTLTVEVTEAAQTVDAGEESPTIENQATVEVGNVKNTTNIAICDVEEAEEPVEPESPKTGDSNALLLSLLTAAMGVALVSAAMRRKKEEECQ